MRAKFAVIVLLMILGSTALAANGSGTCGLFTDDAVYGAGENPYSTAIGDLNGDGHPDLAVANHNSDDVSVLLNKGNGTFAPPVDYGVDDGPRSVAVGDLDGNGDLDLAVTNIWSNNVSVLLNQSPPPCPADLDGDCEVGVKDLLELLGNWGPCP